MIKIDENGKIIIKPQLLRSMSTRSEWGERSSSTKEQLKDDHRISITREMSRISFESTRPSVDRSMSLDSKVTGYKTRIVSEPIYSMN